MLVIASYQTLAIDQASTTSTASAQRDVAINNDEISSLDRIESVEIQSNKKKCKPTACPTKRRIIYKPTLKPTCKKRKTNKPTAKPTYRRKKYQHDDESDPTDDDLHPVNDDETTDDEMVDDSSDDDQSN